MHAAIYMEVGSNYFYSAHAVIYVWAEIGQKLSTISRSSLNFGGISSHFNRGPKFQNFREQG